MDGKFEIDNFWEDEDSLVYQEFSCLSDRLKAKIIKRIEVFERKSIGQLFRENQLEKVKNLDVAMYELRIRISPPVRMLGTLEAHTYKPFRIFVKKTERIPLKEIRTAVERIKNYQ